MTPMPPEPQHARQRDRMSSVIAVSYAVLIWAGASSVIFNVVHAFRHGGGDLLLPALYGVGPAFVAVCLSHIAAEGRTGKILRSIVVLIMLASMAGSIGATATVATPFAGKYLAWLYGLILDAGALAALRVILSDRTRRRDETTALDQATAAAEAARQQASEATGKAAGLEAELTAARTDLDAARAEVQQLKSALTSRRKSGRSRTRSSGARKPASSGAGSVPEDAVSIEARALAILAEGKITGRELGERLGVTESYACRLKKNLAPAVDAPEQSQ